MTKTDYLNVPVASLYYEVSGAGPVLLMIPGGAADSGDFARIAPILADRYTVVRHDPRGIERSRIDGPPEDVSAEVLADDAHRVLQATATEPAYVFGSSGGGLTGLALVARHPEQVRTLVAHEPPAYQLLRDGDPRRSGFQDVFDTFRKEGVGPAAMKFAAVTGLGQSGPPTELPPEMPEALALMPDRMARMKRTAEFTFAHMFPGLPTALPDIATLKAVSSQIVVGVGEDASGQLAHDTGPRPGRAPGSGTGDLPR